jgi:hypothetical protein
LLSYDNEIRSRREQKEHAKQFAGHDANHGQRGGNAQPGEQRRHRSGRLDFPEQLGARGIAGVLRSFDMYCRLRYLFPKENYFLCKIKQETRMLAWRQPDWNVFL